MRLAAVLAKGLGENSRVMRKLSGTPPVETVLLARIVDELRVLQWQMSGAKKKDFPESITEKMMATSGSRTKEGYDSGADFDRAWKELTENV